MMPTFSFQYGDFNDTKFYFDKPRPLYLDMITSPGSTYKPMDIEIIVPETLDGNSLPVGKICSVELVYVGMYSHCVRKHAINDLTNNHIIYHQRFYFFFTN